MIEWFTSDTHFGHKNILHLGKGRPFASVEEMDETMISNWNDRVAEGDLIYHLGDFAFGDHYPYLRRLNGQKRLIKGNHDRSNRLRNAAEAGWATVDDILHTKAQDGTLLVLCHYGMRVWNGSHHGSIHLFGHSHGNLRGDSQSLDVGVDPWGFRPITLSEIKDQLAWLPVRGEPDHHHAKEIAA